MLLSALKKKRFLAIAILFGLVALITLATSFFPSKPTSQIQAQQVTSPRTTTSTLNTTNLQSNSFSSADEDDTKRLFFMRDILRETTSYLTCQISGIEPIDPKVDCIKALSANIPNKEQLFKSGGLIAMTGSSFSLFNTRPASSIAYTKDAIDNFGIVKNAKAQQNNGTGFNSLNQIQDIWILFRNIAYLLLVVVFVIIGILIMLRVNIDPRTVMTIQNQIPKAIVAIVLITFSYAIGGLLVDAMWIGTYFGVNLVTSTQAPCEKDGKQISLTSVVTKSLLDNPIAFTTDILGDETGCAGKWDGINGLVVVVAQSFGDIFSRISITIFGADEAIGDCQVQTKFFGLIPVGLEEGSSFTNCIKLALFSILKYLIMIVAYLVVLIAILAALFRVWFSLLKSYIFLILEIMLAPFYILLGLIPGSSLSFKGWIRGIIAQLAVFPAVTFLLVLASILAKNSDLNTPGQGVFLPPLIGNPNIADNLGALLAFGLILMAPDIGNMVREALKAPASKNTAGITAGIGLAAGKVMGSGKDVTERISKRNDTMIEKGVGPQARKGLFRLPFVDRAVG